MRAVGRLQIWGRLPQMMASNSYIIGDGPRLYPAADSIQTIPCFLRQENLLSIKSSFFCLVWCLLLTSFREKHNEAHYFRSGYPCRDNRAGWDLAEMVPSSWPTLCYA